MGRPSRLEATIEGDRVRVGGGVVPLIEGQVNL
jgi:predicted PhzF superfamily epimerase YddE/YHI9